MTRIVLVPGVPALLPEYASIEDPVASLRAACRAAVAWLGPEPGVVADAAGARVAAALAGLDTPPPSGSGTRPATVLGGLDTPPPSGSGTRPANDRGSGAGEGRWSGAGEGRWSSASASERIETPADTYAPGILVVGNGSARRTEAAPGPFDARAVPFDDALGAALRSPAPSALRALDPALARELWADTGAFDELADLLADARLVAVDYDDAPYGVQYWVMRWES